MRLLRAMLLINAVASIGYGIGLLVPGLFPAPDMSPEGVVWPRYLVPIYLGLGVIAWQAYRNPRELIGIAWALVLIWAGLVITHLVNMWLGDEEVGMITLGNLVHDSVQGVLLLLGILLASRRVQVSAQGSQTSG